MCAPPPPIHFVLSSFSLLWLAFLAGRLVAAPTTRESPADLLTCETRLSHTQKRSHRVENGGGREESIGFLRILVAWVGEYRD